MKSSIAVHFSKIFQQNLIIVARYISVNFYKMKPLQEDNGDAPENNSQVTGDVIGKTAYSERFVLKILLKFANLHTLKEEVTEKSFEEDLGTLWDMTAEQDVVDFLQKHNVLGLFQFALPSIESPRIIELIIGITTNMCCDDDVVTSILNMDGLITRLVGYVTSEDCLIIIQALRFLDNCVQLCRPMQRVYLLDIFKSVGYSSALYHILKNSMNKNLLIRSLEHFNTLCHVCSYGITSGEFYKQFVRADALKALSCAFNEITLKEKYPPESYEFGRMLNISLQIILVLIEYKKSSEMFKSCKSEIKQMVQFVMTHNNSLLVHLDIICPGFEDLVRSINTITRVLKFGDIYDEECLHAAYNVWKTAKLHADFEGTYQHTDAATLKYNLCTFMCRYIEACDEKKLQSVLDKIHDDYDEILPEEMQSAITKKRPSYRSRINENVDA